MQTQDPNTRSPGAVDHPNTAEWMAFLYGELAPERRRELDIHLSRCAGCKEQVQNWREGMDALDEWKLPKLRPAPRQRFPILKWAVAAAIVLIVGFALGRQTSSSAKEVAALKASVANLTKTVDQDRDLNVSNAVAAANAQTVQLLAEYAKLNEEHRAADQQAIATALQSYDLRLARLRSELETVAVNTEDSFQQTQEGLTRLALAAAPASPIPTH